jgi:hypothetical protein
MWVQNQKPSLGTGAYRLPPVGPASQAKERSGRTTIFSSSAMSSGRLLLDRVGRRQSPSPLHRRDQNKLIAWFEGRIYHPTVSCVLTGCLTFRDKRIVMHHGFRERGELHPLLPELMNFPHDLFDRPLATIEDGT